MNSPNKSSTLINRHINQLNFDLKRGFLQFVTIHLISQRPKYAHEIKEEILNITNGMFNIDRNNLYKKLRQLEKDGFLESYLEPSIHGADRKYYAITPFGRKLHKGMYKLLIPVMTSLHKKLKHK